MNTLAGRRAVLAHASDSSYERGAGLALRVAMFAARTPARTRLAFASRCAFLPRTRRHLIVPTEIILVIYYSYRVCSCQWYPEYLEVL